MNDGSDSCSPGGTNDEPPQSGRAGQMFVDIIEDAGNWAAISDIDDAVRTAAAAASEFPETGLAEGLAAIALSDDTHIAALNADYRGKSSPTNVLSFPAAPDLPSVMPEERFLGDIILAAETVMREASDLDIPPRHHVQHLVVHGLLHLTGFDHDTDAAAETMEALETRILATLDIPDPYAQVATKAQAQAKTKTEA